MQQMQYMTAPPDIQQGAAELFQQQRLAELLRKQATDPIKADEYTKTGGGQWAAPAQIVSVGLGQGLAKMGQAALGGYMDNKANEDHLALAQKLKDARNQEFEAYQQAGQASPEQPMGPPTEDGQYGLQPAKEANPMAQALRGIQSFDPTLQKLGTHQLTTQMDQRATQDLLKSIQGMGQPQQPAAPVAPPAISTSNDAATKLSPTSEIAAPAGPITAQQQQLIAADMAKRGDAQGVAALAPPEPTPLEKYAKTVGYTQQQAQAMEASGNKTLMALGKQINAGYQQATLESVVKQPGRVALATQAQDAADARQDKQIAAADTRAANRLVATALPPLSDTERVSGGAQVAAGRNAREIVPGWGPAARQQQRELNREAIDQIKAENPGMDDARAGQELAMRSIGFKADSSSVQQLTKMEGATIPVVKQLNYNIDRTTEILKTLGDRDISPVINAIADNARVWSGDPKYASLFFHLQGAAIEAARMRSGGQASIAQLHAGAVEEAKKWSDSHMTPATWADVSKAMKDEGAEKLKFYGQAKDAMKNRAGGQGGSPAPAAPPAGERTFKVIR